MSGLLTEAYSTDGNVNWKNVIVDTVTGGVVGTIVGAGAVTSIACGMRNIKGQKTEK